MNWLLVFLFFWANEVIYEYSNDSLGVANDSLETWIQHKLGVEAQYELVEHYWRQGRYQDALNLLQSIPSQYKLEKIQFLNHNALIHLKALLQTAYSRGRTEATLERQEVNTLVNIATQKYGSASVQANNILRFFYGTGDSYYPILPRRISARTIQPNNNETTEKEELTIVEPRLWGFPNPAINWIDIQFELPKDIDNSNLSSQLVITSTSGQIMQTIELQGTKGITQLNTTDWAGGIYFAVLFTNKTKGAVYKFVVRK